MIDHRCVRESLPGDKLGLTRTVGHSILQPAHDNRVDWHANLNLYDGISSLEAGDMINTERRSHALKAGCADPRE